MIDMNLYNKTEVLMLTDIYTQKVGSDKRKPREEREEREEREAR